METNEIKALDSAYIANTYARYDLCIKNGKGATCFDNDGKSYIDLGSGIGVNSLGYCDEDWTKAVIEQVNTLQHTSNLYYHEVGAKLAKKLCDITGYKKVFFGNSGAEANEGAIKVARKYSFDKYGKGRSKIITLVNSFHGRTVTTLSATGQDVFHDFFFPFTEDFVYTPANDIESLEKTVADNKDKVCAIMLEFIQGEGGVMPLEQDFVKAIDKICKQNDILLVADEVQTGVGRTGKFLASEHFNVTPDVTTLAKGLGGGLPIGAVLLGDKVESTLGFSQHGTTFGANPVVCAGALAVLDKVANEEFLNQVTQKGEFIREFLSLVGEVESISGLGLMLGIKLKSKTASDVVKKAIEYGIIPLTAKDRVRLLPPLNITQAELVKAMNILCEVLLKK